MKPVVAIVGRPNVGKSTLLNRIIGRRDAIVEERPGVTRDRKEVDANWRGREFTLVDTGGLLFAGDQLDQKVSRQSKQAIADADVVLFVVDVTVGVTEDDARVAALLRPRAGSVVVVANKVDDDSREALIWELLSFGLGDPEPVSAIHGRRTGDLLDRVIDLLPEESEAPVDEESDEDRIVGVALIGRPNVGKSTLFNRLIGEERAVVHDQPGTTRDSIDTVVETDHGPVRFIDTAGMRRRARIDERTEYYSLVRALRSLDTADVADQVGQKLHFVGEAPVIKISALSGKNVQRLWPALSATIEDYQTRIPTRRVNDVVRKAQAAHPAPDGARVLYATQGATDPPTFTLFANRELPRTWLRYLERRFREDLDLGSTPIKLRVRRRSD